MISGSDFNQHCRFPSVVLYRDGDMSIFDEMDALVICRGIDLKAGQRGRFARASIVDSNAMVWEVDGATKLHGVGSFWGYNLCLSQTIRVQPNVCAPPKLADLDIVKGEVVKRLGREQAVITLDLNRVCATIEHDEALRALPLIEAAASVPEIISELLAMNFPE
ncbi:MAG: hypothetical protein KJ579_12840 [Verrucomicrobia bacterium]|nr:hypothetical protein [Verrucomicrobiota bacterium]